jgi:phosphoglycerol transferase MdoB-like AlkP superfamily enzyme
MQRADADMLFVMRNPFDDSTYKIWVMIIAMFLFLFVATWYFYRQLDKLMISKQTARNSFLILLLPVFFISIFFVTGTKKILPTYPLTNLNPTQLPLVQNSLHTFLYSLYRRKETSLPATRYMPLRQQQAIFQIEKKNNTTTTPKNIVLFIMESVPIDFFDRSSPYKVPMPFLDSLVQKSTFYSNAFSYSYNSNKGITAILSGLPTITDIPLYHANYTSIKRTSVGRELKRNGYQSAFFIGDNYDDFGFAKCSRWLGIEQYYSMEAIPGYKKMEKHSMGLHDEFVLNFMQEELKKMQSPFFTVQYNISTHYPNDVPTSFKNKYPEQKGTPQMLSMLYYNDCLHQFFDSIRSEPWYKNTVFIFCSDHWAQPQYNYISMDKVESFRIPLFIYEPANETGTVVHSPVSQFDIVNTVLYYAGIGRENFISYGTNLKDSVLAAGRTVFCKTNAAIYQAINDEYVLGFNGIEGTPLYCYAYKIDPEKKNNLLLQPANAAINKLILEMKAFLQTAVSHYRGRL